MAAISGTGKPDTIAGTDEDDVINGLGGSDRIDAGEGSDSLLGGQGDDTLLGWYGVDTLLGGEGNDVLFDHDLFEEHNVMEGGDGDDTVNGGPESELRGGSGFDSGGLRLFDELTLDEGMNVDLSGLHAGGVFTFETGAVFAGFETGFIAFTFDGDRVVASSMDLLIDGFSGDDTLTGGGRDDHLIGGGLIDNDTDKLFGNGGADTLEGGVHDTLDGGRGVDVFSLYLGDMDTSLNLDLRPLAKGGDLVATPDTVLRGMESGNLVLSFVNDQVQVRTAHVSVYGAEGNDRLTGGALDDLLGGDLGDDTLIGGGGSDTADYQNAERFVVVDLSIGDTQNTRDGRDKLVDIENLRGSAYGDRLTGDKADNRLFGGDGGDDTLTAGGDGGKDTLFGGAGSDTLEGGGGADSLVGGFGGDMLYGGDDADVFAWLAVKDSLPSAPDRIADLAADDTIDLSAIDANTGAGGDQAFTWAAAFTGHAGQATLAFDGTDTALRLDVNGDGTADTVILISGDHHDHAGFVL